MAVSFILLFFCSALSFSSGSSLPEWFHNISTNLFSLSGDIMIGGLFPINRLTSNLSERKEPNNISCQSLNTIGLGLSLVMKYAVDEINANQSLLPGIKLGYEIYDTCGQSAVLVRPTLSFLTQKSTTALSVQCNYTDYEPNISAVIGPYTSEMVSIIGKLMGFFLMPQISYGATSDKFSDKLLYPSFFRTVPSDKWQVQAMVDLLNQFGWNWVAVVGSEEEYGQRGVQEFSKLAANKSICVAYQGLIPVYADPASAIETIIDNINKTKVGVIVVFALPKQTEAFFRQVINCTLERVWIASTSWTISNEVMSLKGINTTGTVLGFVDQTETLDLLMNYTEQLFNKLSEKTVDMTPPKSKSGFTHSMDPFNPCPTCWHLSRANTSQVIGGVVQRQAFSVYAATYSAAWALHRMLGCNSSACAQGPGTNIYPWKLLQFLRNSSVHVNGKNLVYDSKGNPNIGYDVIQWNWTDLNNFIPIGNFSTNLTINKGGIQWHKNETPTSKCSAKCEKGQVRRVKGFHSCCFDCIDCLPGTYQKHNDSMKCTSCPEGQWSTKRSTNCTEPMYEVLFWHKAETVGLVLAGVLLLVCQSSVSVLFLKSWGTPVVKASGGVMAVVALLSLMGTCLSLMLFLGQPGDVICSLQLPLTSIFQTVALSIITSISLQICFMSEFPKQAAAHLQVIRGPGSCVFVLVCCAVQAETELRDENNPSYLATVANNSGCRSVSQERSPGFGLPPLSRNESDQSKGPSTRPLSCSQGKPVCYPHLPSATMSRERRARPDNSEMDTDGAELELAKLQRQLRTMEKDHQAYSLQAREQIRKQEQEIEMLLKEQDELHRNLGACESASRQLQDGEDSQRLRALLKQDDMLEEALQKEKQCQKEIEKEISQMQGKLAALRKQEASAGHTQRSTECHTHRTVATMENKLDKALTCFNKQLAKNSHLREELQTLHKDRGHFQELKNRLEKELQDIRKQIGEMVSLSTAAYDARAEGAEENGLRRVTGNSRGGVQEDPDCDRRGQPGHAGHQVHPG
ncbi:uncharacterized protein V6R79_003512 [Siganus canaliculatus]